MIRVDILLIIPPFHMRNGGGSFFPLGTGYLISAIEKHGYSWAVENCTELISSFYQDELELLVEKLEKRLKVYAPKVIGVGPCVTTQLRGLIRIANICKKNFPNTPIFAGGPFASIDGQEKVFNSIIGIDYLVKGDGEEAVPGIIKYVKKNGTIDGCEYISCKGCKIVNVIEDLDGLAFPYRDVMNKDFFSQRRQSESGKQMAMIASRGCPYRCNYCVSGNMKGNHVTFRKRSNDNVIKEMIFLRDTYSVDNIVFYDDCFFTNYTQINEEVNDFCNLLKENDVRMKWQIEMRPDFFVRLNEKSLKRLIDCGCLQINLGIEKISQSGKAFLGKDGNPEGLLEKVNIAKVIGIKISATFIIGGSNEEKEDVKRLVEYARSLPLSFAHFNPLFVYPGTPIYRTFFSDEVEWAQKVLHDDLPWGEVIYETEKLGRNEILSLVDYAYKEFYRDRDVKENMIRDRFNIKRGYSNANI